MFSTLTPIPSHSNVLPLVFCIRLGGLNYWELTVTLDHRPCID